MGEAGTVIESIEMEDGSRKETVVDDDPYRTGTYTRIIDPEGQETSRTYYYQNGSSQTHYYSYDESGNQTETSQVNNLADGSTMEHKYSYDENGKQIETERIRTRTNDDGSSKITTSDPNTHEIFESETDSQGRTTGTSHWKDGHKVEETQIKYIDDGNGKTATITTYNNYETGEESVIDADGKSTTIHHDNSTAPRSRESEEVQPSAPGDRGRTDTPGKPEEVPPSGRGETGTPDEPGEETDGPQEGEEEKPKQGEVPSDGATSPDAPAEGPPPVDATYGGADNANAYHEKIRGNIQDNLANSPYERGVTPRTAIDELAADWTTDGGIEKMQKMQSISDNLMESVKNMESAASKIGSTTVELQELNKTEGCIHH